MSNESADDVTSNKQNLSEMQLLLGPNLLVSANKKESTSTALGDASIVALYFSASWCPPCKAFTPLLTKFYEAHGGKSMGVKIIFVSSDHDVPSFNEYFSKMPWLAIPHEAQYIRKELGSTMKVQGIPTLIILDPKTGKFISDSGKSEIMSAGSEAKAKELVTSWKAKESLPLEKLGEGEKKLVNMLMRLIRDPCFLIGAYFVLKFLYGKFNL